ncbi:MAG TPA: CPBP family intramembrane glutamic endopeptidase [Vitreimonas sp.]|jgi:membrane protease YdiL (CAAX protease family)|nr:CPBP family intramembrane glutamic endopeptidase [Vitreimonas sp.]
MPDIPDPLRHLIVIGLTLLLVMLRLDAERFGAAEYDEATRDGHLPSFRRRMAWYGLGVGLVIGIVFIHPAPQRDLFLGSGDRLATLVGGLGYAILGALQAIGFAWLRYRHLRLPEVASYPGALVNSLATAFIDEAVYRGALYGILLGIGINPTTANVMQALLYALSTRLGAPGRDRYMLVLALVIGLAGGWLTSATGGVAAAFLGHAVTRFSVFLCTGHAGQVAPRGAEREDIERRRRTPEGWRIIGSR